MEDCPWLEIPMQRHFKGLTYNFCNQTMKWKLIILNPKENVTTIIHIQTKYLHIQKRGIKINNNWVLKQEEWEEETNIYVMLKGQGKAVSAETIDIPAPREFYWLY